MHIILIIIASIIVITGSVVSKSRGETNGVSVTINTTSSSTPVPTEVPSDSPTTTLTPSPTMKTTNTPTKIVENLTNPLPNFSNNFRYPNGITIVASDSQLKIESRDSTDTITDWYKQKINDLGMNTKSFVKTKANEKVLNTLVGNNGNREIRVTISQENSESVVLIEVTIKSY